MRSVLGRSLWGDQGFTTLLRRELEKPMAKIQSTPHLVWAPVQPRNLHLLAVCRAQLGEPLRIGGAIALA